MKDVNKKMILIYLILIIYFIINIIIGFTSLDKIFVKFFNPLFLFLISFFTYYLIKETRSRNRNKYFKLRTIILIMIGYCLLYYLSGLLFSFVTNENLFSKIITNFISVFLVIIFKEYIRYKMIYSSKKKSNLFLTTLLFVLLDISYLVLINSFSDDIIIFILNSILPILIINITSTYLVYKLDYLSNYIYRGILGAITIFSPYLPKHNWVMNNFFLVGLLVVFIYSIDYLVALDDRRNKRMVLKRRTVVYNCIFVIGALMFILFVGGTFKYQPIAIMSNSMEEYFSRGDVVVIKKIEQDNVCSLELGDVIYYKHEEKFITHRILDKNVNGNSCIFYTKGDNNNFVDDWGVEKIDVVGVIKFRIKYIGWPSVLLYEALS